MLIVQQGDVLLFQTNDDGDIVIEDGITQMSGGLATAAYLALFGGNEDDDGTLNNKFQYWANWNENESSKKYQSETQYLLKSIPATSGNLRRIEQAAIRDLAFFIEIGAASDISAVATIPGLNKVRIAATITAQGDETEFVFIENWKAES
jgi:hypothetical protein